MRYRKDSIELNQSRDVPLLRQILRSECATHAQLFEFMRLNHVERSRKSFDWRLRRLVRNGFVVQREVPTCRAQPVYSIGRSGALLLQGRGEYCLLGCPRTRCNDGQPAALHALELNEIHLSALRSGVLARWIPAAEIRSQNELTGLGYTMRELELCLGEDHRKISGWIANGWLQDRLQGTRRHDGNGNDIHRIREQDILNFMKNHPQEINLGKVDQTWFLDLVLLRGREVPEAKSPRRGEREEEVAAA